MEVENAAQGANAIRMAGVASVASRKGIAATRMWIAAETNFYVSREFVGSAARSRA